MFFSTDPQTIKDACTLGISTFIEKYQGMTDHELLIITYNAIRMQYNIPNFNAKQPVTSRSVTFRVIAMHSSKPKENKDETE